MERNRNGTEVRPARPAGLLRTFRLRRTLTQRELADRAGLSERTLRGLEAGWTVRARPDTVRRLADALGLSPEERTELAVVLSGAEGPSPKEAPSLLPPEVGDFAGRRAELAVLLGLAAGADPVGTGIAAVSGPPGVGKSALVVHAAHRLRGSGAPPNIFRYYSTSCEVLQVLRGYLLDTTHPGMKFGISKFVIPKEAAKAAVEKSATATAKATGQPDLNVILIGKGAGLPFETPELWEPVADSGTCLALDGPHA